MLFFIRYITLLSLIFIPVESSFAAGGSNDNPAIEDKTRLLISKIHSDNFSHVGGEQALNIMLKQFEPYSNNRDDKILEVGSGYGATANYIYERGFKNITGIDIKEEYVRSASENYPAIEFKTSDVTTLTDDFFEDQFSLVFMINTAVAIADKPALWQKIKNISKRGAILITVDFIVKDKSHLNAFTKPDGSPRYPILLAEAERYMKFIGWRVLEKTDITKKYLKWYSEYIENIKENYSSYLVTGFTAEELDYATEYFEHIIDLLNSGKLAGYIIIAKKV